MTLQEDIRALAMQVLKELLGGLALILLAVSLIIVYGHALGVHVW